MNAKTFLAANQLLVSVTSLLDFGDLDLVEVLEASVELAQEMRGDNDTSVVDREKELIEQIDSIAGQISSVFHSQVIGNRIGIMYRSQKDRIHSHREVVLTGVGTDRFYATHEGVDKTYLYDSTSWITILS